jgi:hypothetical protein
MPIVVGGAILAGAGIQGATSLAGGKKGSSAATQAANIQAATARQALAVQQGEFQQAQFNLAPFIDYGRTGFDPLQAAIPQLTSQIDTSLPQFTFQPTMADLAQTPGYQFALTQGTEAAQARLAAGGLGRGGPAARGAANYASGLAAQTWPQVFNANLSGYQANVNSLLAGRTMDLQQRQQVYNLLSGRINTGLQAADASAGVSTNAASTLGSTITGIGAAQASGVVGSANALTAGLTGAGSAAGNAASSFALVNALQNPGANPFNAPVDSGLAYMQNPNLMVGGTA